jgi:hypothetical protein
MQRARKNRPLSRWEVLGAWLRLWTPPRDVDVPPVPWRKVAALAGLVVAAAIAFAVVGLPAINDSNRKASDRQARIDARLHAERNRQIAASQVPHRARATPARSAAERHALVDRLEQRVGADARARVKSGALTGTIRRVDCVPTPSSRPGGVAPEDDLERARGGYDCTAVTSDIVGHKGAAVGYPFQGVIDFRRGRLTWCKTNPPPGEQVIPDPRSVVRLPASCRDPGSAG